MVANNAKVKIMMSVVCCVGIAFNSRWVQTARLMILIRNIEIYSLVID